MIEARAHTDDYVFDIRFDVTPWLKKAPVRLLKEVAKEGWGQGYACDQVAQAMSTRNKELKKMFQYIEILRNTPHAQGFDVHIDGMVAMDWLRRNRPKIYKLLSR